MEFSEVHSIVVHDGSIGINLKAKESGIGAYIETFYRTPHGYMLPAEKSGVLSIGDIIHSVNDESVLFVTLNEIHKMITSASRPLSLAFKRPELKLEGDRLLSTLTRDPKKLTFIDQYLLQNCNKINASVTAKKIIRFNYCEVVLESLSSIVLSLDDWKLVLKSCYDSEFGGIVNQLDEIDSSLSPPLPPSNISLDLNENEYSQLCAASLTELKNWLEKDLMATFVPSFFQTIASKRMIAFLSDTPSLRYINIGRLLSNNSTQFFIYVFLAQVKRFSTYLEYIVNI